MGFCGRTSWWGIVWGWRLSGSTCGAAPSCAWRREALETIYARGGRKFLVWGLVAIEQVPIVQTVNKYVNVLDEFFTHTYNDTTTQYGLKVSVRQLLLYQLPCRSYIEICLTWAQSSAPESDTLCQLLCSGPV